jgi:peptide/nickel transport system substrate-binding protein
MIVACAPAVVPTPAPTTAPAAQPTTAPAAQPTTAPVAQPTTAPPPTSAPSAGNKVVSIAFTQEPNSLNPLYTDQWFSMTLRDFYLRTGLVTYNDKNEPVAQIATELPSAANGGVSADGKTITYKLRSDVKWSDGTPLTADDYVFTWEMAMNDKNLVTSRAPWDTYVDKVEATDPTTLVVTFKEPYAPYLATIFVNSYGTNALPKHILQPVFDKDGTIDNAEWNRAPTVGVGPFVFKEWETGSHITFEANPNNPFPSAPKVNQIFVRIVPDDAAQVAAIKAGDADIGTFISYADVPDLQSLGTVDVPVVQSGYKESWFINLSAEGDTAGHPALQDKNVRRAIVMAVDRNKITQELLNGLTKPALTFWDGTAFADTSITPIPFDPEGAKKLLDDAGWKVGADGIREKDGVKLKLRYLTTTREVRQNTQAIVQQQWKDIGVDSELAAHPSDIFFNGFAQDGPVARGQYDIAEWSDAPSFPDPDTAKWLCDEVPSDATPDGGNWQFLCDEELNALFLEQAGTVDLAKRIEVFKKIQKRMADEVYWVSIWDDPDLWTVSKKLQNANLSGATPFSNSQNWDKVQ